MLFYANLQLFSTVRDRPRQACHLHIIIYNQSIHREKEQRTGINGISSVLTFLVNSTKFTEAHTKIRYLSNL